MPRYLLMSFIYKHSLFVKLYVKASPKVGELSPKVTDEGGAADTARLRAIPGRLPLICLWSGPQTPSPEGEGFQWYSLAVTASRFGAWAPLAFCDRCA